MPSEVISNIPSSLMSTKWTGRSLNGGDDILN